MASYTVEAGKIGVQAKTLAANTVDTVTFNDDLDAVVVFSDGAAALYFTVDGTTPTIGGDNTYVLLKGVHAARRVLVPTSGDTVVKLISSGAPTYSVEEGTDEDAQTGVAAETTQLEVRDQVTAAAEALAGTLRAADVSPPLTPLTHIGVDVNPDEDTVVAVAAAGRVKVSVNHKSEADGRVWVGVGQLAQEDVGDYIDPGFSWSEFTADEIHVLIVGAGAPQRLTGMEWAT